MAISTNKQDYIDSSTQMYDMDAINDVLPERPDDGAIPEEYMTGDDYQVAGLGSVARKLANRMTPEHLRQERSVKELREQEIRPSEATEEEIRAVVDHLQREGATPEGLRVEVEGPYSGAEQRPVEGRTDNRNINLSNLNTADDVKQTIDSVVQLNAGAMEARRGRLNYDSTIQMANDIDAIELITGWKPATTWNAEQITAARQLLVDTAQAIQSESVRLMKNPELASELDWANFAKLHKVFDGISQTVAGATAEAGRTLSSMKIPVEGNDRANAIRSILEANGGPDLMRKKAQLIADLDGDPDAIARQISDAIESPNQGVLAEIWINAQLSSPATHMVNVTSNSFVQLYESFMVKPTAAAIGAIRKSVTGADDVVSFDEVGAEAFGMMGAFGEAMELFSRRVVAGHGHDLDLFNTPSKTEMSDWNAFSAQRLLPNSMKGTSLARAVDLMGDYYVRLPGRFLESEDLFFKTITYRKELNALAVRTAKNEKLGGEAYKSRVHDLINNPTKEMNDAASARADYETFTGDPGEVESLFGDVAKSVSYLTSRHPSLKFIAPFVRTPANIIRYSIENSIMSPVTKKWRNDFKAGGVKKDMALARWSLGTMAFISIQQMYDSGIITGSGPSDPSSRRLMRQNLGWQQYSIRSGDTYYAYNRMDPMGFSASMFAGAMDRIKYARSDEEATVLSLELTMSLGEAFMDKTFFTGFAEMFALASDPSLKQGTQFASNITSRFVPAWVNVAARAEDIDADDRGVARDARRFSKSYEGIWQNFSKTMDNRTPWAREDLPAQRDWKGEIVSTSGGGYADELFFIRKSDAVDDVPTRALLENWVAPSVPQQVQSFLIPAAIGMQFGVTEMPVDLLDLDENGGAVFETFQTYVGKARHSIISDWTNSDQYKELSDSMKGNNSVTSSVLKSLLETGLKAGKIQFFADYNTLAEQNGWRKFDDEDILNLLEQKYGAQGKIFETPEAPADENQGLRF